MNEEIRSLLAEAAEWRLAGLVFEHPSDQWREQIDRLAAETGDPRLKEAALAARDEITAGTYLALYRPTGPISLREVTYAGGAQFGYLMSELAAQYAAFGYQPETPEMADHFSVQLGFLAYLKLKQAYALLSGNAEQAAIAAEAAAQFRKDHLAVSTAPILHALENLAPPCLALACASLYERIGPAPATPYSCDSDDEETACGPALIQPGS